MSTRVNTRQRASTSPGENPFDQQQRVSHEAQPESVEGICPSSMIDNPIPRFSSPTRTTPRSHPCRTTPTQKDAQQRPWSHPCIALCSAHARAMTIRHTSHKTTHTPCSPDPRPLHTTVRLQVRPHAFMSSRAIARHHAPSSLHAFTRLHAFTTSRLHAFWAAVVSVFFSAARAATVAAQWGRSARLWQGKEEVAELGRRSGAPAETGKH